MRNSIEIRVWMLRRNIRLVDISRALGISDNFVRFWINNERESQRVKEYFLNVLKVPPYLIEVKSQAPLSQRRHLKRVRDPGLIKRNALIHRLAKKGHTQQEIASQVGISQPTISRILRQQNHTLSFNSKANEEGQHV